MDSLTFRKRIVFADLPPELTVVRCTLDWSGEPLLLLAEGKGHAPDFRKDPNAWSRWYRTPPKAHHVLYWDGAFLKTQYLDQARGISSFHIQRFAEGWLLGERRGGGTLIYGKSGLLIKTLNLGDASEDLQSTPDGMIWVTYFDEGVFGNGVGTQGAICFDSNGSAIFRFADFARTNGLPPIYDCYAINVSPTTSDVWLNYYNAFPLVQLRRFELEHVWQPFRCMDNGFAIREDRVIYIRGGEFRSSRLDSAEESDSARAQDEDGKLVTLDGGTHSYAAGRGPSFIVNTGTALYELVP